MDQTLSDRLTIRKLRPQDLPGLEWGGELTHYRRLFEQAYQQYTNGQAILWIAELPAIGIVAQVFIQLNSHRSELADGETRAYLYGFRVREPHRNQGIGTQLLESVEADLKQRGFSQISLNVSQDNHDARRLYERFDYKVMATDPGRWSYFDERGQRVDVNEPAWRMVKLLR